VDSLERVDNVDCKTFITSSLFSYSRRTSHETLGVLEDLVEHKRKREYKPSGSGASADIQEFRFYGEMSFLIPYYVPRP